MQRLLLVRVLFAIAVAGGVREIDTVFGEEAFVQRDEHWEIEDGRIGCNTNIERR
jgi:hypothetical protein